MQGANRGGEGGEESLLSDPGSELRLLMGGREKGRTKGISGKKEEEEKNSTMYSDSV